MKAFLKTVTCFLFTLVILFGAFSNDALALGDFSQTCYNSQVNGSVLSAICRRINGSYNDTSINLNPGIENVDGQLKWQPSNFIATCRNTGLTGPSVMSAECKTRAQRWVSTSINLDDHIANIDGTLMYE
ncbi:MAG: CVNH domain-containing protein [Nostocaceae cyanobacterium]|nr:CVNH domain-containing protein [Nostocaceae cyanobacterium]